MQEIWKTINGYEGLYEVSSYGRVKSLERTKQWKGVACVVKERVLKSYISKNNLKYASVVLYKNNRKKTYAIHRLVAETFIGEIPKGMVVNHIDHNPLNNYTDNLEIITHEENSKHSIQFRKENGIQFNTNKNKHPEIDLGLTEEELQSEQWADIKGYEGLYQISNLGRVKSLKRKIYNGSCYFNSRERVLKHSLNKCGYLHIKLCKNSKHTNYRIHQLVAEHFHGPRPSTDHVVNHIDHNKHNNRASNLEYVTYQDNSIKYQEFRSVA